jgi:iron complex transport system substrate-binding protein
VIRVLALLGATLLAGCGGGVADPAPLRSPTHDRIVSIDYCADQMVLGLAARHRIAAVSHEATADPLFAGRLAGDLPRVRPDAEAILALRPTLVVRSYAGGARLEALLTQAGVRVFTLPYAGTLAEVRAGVVASGTAMGATAAATARVRQFDRELAGGAAGTRTALYTTPGDYTAGPGTLINEIVQRGGWRNAERRDGWHRLDAERLIVSPPALLIRAFGESTAHQTDRWSGSNHHALRSAFARSAEVAIPGSWVACGNWRAGHAVARLREVRQ